MKSPILIKLSQVNERTIFLFLILLNSLPLLLFPFYPSMDGAAHLYNSNIIVRLLLDNDSIYHKFYEFTPILVPNWLGHFILAFFNSFLPAMLAEKILLISYSILLPVSFRYMVRKFSPNVTSLSYLVLPFTYHFLFILGYYNFSLSFILFFFLIGFIHKVSSQKLTIKQTIFLIFLFFLMSVTHIFGFALLMLAMGIYFLWKIILQSKNSREIFKIIFSYLKFLLLSIPGFVIITLHLIHHQSESAVASVSEKENLWDFIMMIRPLVAYNFGKESGPTTIMFLIIFSLLIVNIFIRINDFKNKNHKKWKHLFKTEDFWLFFTFIMLIIILFSPKSLGGAGNLLNRFGLAFFLAVISWLNFNNIPKWFYKTLVVFFVIANGFLIEYYVRVINGLNNDAMEIYHSSQFIKENSTVYAYNASDHWLQIHFSNYLAVEKSIFVNDNYEASTGYFPVKWKIKKEKLERLNPEIYDYFYIYGVKRDKLPQDLTNLIYKNYESVYTSEKVQIFQVSSKSGE